VPPSSGAGFAAGELLARGPGEDVLADLDAAGPQPSESALHDASGLPYWLLAVVLGALALLLLLRRSRGGLEFGVIAGAALAVRGPLRLPDRAQALRGLIGGLLMGIGGW
jgi:hypothetical protein